MKLLSAIVSGLMALSLLSAAPVLAQAAGEVQTQTSSPIDTSEACKGANLSTTNTDCEQTSFLNTFKTIINTIIFIIGAVSVLMIVIGGLRYVTSGGDQQGTKGARDTILYAVIGLVIAFLSFAIVNFVLGRLAETG